MKLTEKDTKTIRTFFTDKPVLKAYIFGSYSRGQADDKSDLDLLVELDYSKHIGLGFVRMKLELEKILKRKVDLVSFKAVSKYIFPFINQDKELIYEK